MIKIVATLFTFVCPFSILLTSTNAQTPYGVYFEPLNGLPNPFGQGFSPKSQKLWNQVSSSSYPIFLDWSKYLDSTSKWNKGNQCQDRSSASYSTTHYQSPINLKTDFTCTDLHRTRVKDPGQCAESEARFYTTPYGLGVDTTRCSKAWWLDHSRNSDAWYLQEIRITTPSEHSANGVQYVGELQLAFKGSGGHGADIAITGIFLALSPTDTPDVEVEKLLRGWETYQSNSYKTCNVMYNNPTCSLMPAAPALTPAAKPIPKPKAPVPKPVAKPVPKPNAPVPKPVAKPVPKPKAPIPRPVAKPALKPKAPAPKPVAKPAAKPAVKPHSRRILQTLERIPVNITFTSDEQDHDRKLQDPCWNGGGCPNSYYCFPNLFWLTNDRRHWKYAGSLTYPPCTENVAWRFIFGTLKISKNQLARIEALNYKHIDPSKCKLATVGSPRNDPLCPCCVNTNRMRQALSKAMNLQQCDNWSTSSTTGNATASSPST